MGTAEALGRRPRRRHRIAVPALAALLLAAGVLCPRASAQSRVFQVPCVPGSGAPLCFAEDAKVLDVDDGDTIDVRIFGAGRHRIRLTGVNATEQAIYHSDPGHQAGECHSLEANALLTSLIKRSHGRVRLLYQNALSRAGRRLVRDVQVFMRGSWHDTGNLLVSRGEALWLPNGKEYAWNRTYSVLSQQAASRHLGLFDSTYCGVGPDQDIPLGVTVYPNAPGNDSVNVNGEWLRIANLGSRPINIGGWWVRDSSTKRYVFAELTTLPAGGRITVHVGRGRDDFDTLYWGLREPIFDNPTSDARALGDGAYLFDPQGDLRAWDMYPCRFSPCQGS